MTGDIPPKICLLVLSLLHTGSCIPTKFVPGLSYLPPPPNSADNGIKEILPAPPNLDIPFKPFGAPLPPPSSYPTEEESCSRICGFMYEPMCGSNGVTYTNECTFSVAACKDVSLTLQGVGSCASIALGAPAFRLPEAPFLDDTPGSGVIPFPPTFGVSDDSAESGESFESPSGGCPEACTKIYAPVCGSNGVTYNNRCLFDIALCKGRSSGSSLSVAFEGPCDSGVADSVDTRTSSVPGSSTSQVRCKEECTKIFLPVCGTDSVTYNNLCLLELASCENVNAGSYAIDVAFESACDSAPSSADSGISGSVDVANDPTRQGPSSSSNVCKEECTKIFLPLCGSDGVTYNNLCLLELASCESVNAGSFAIDVAYESACDVAGSGGSGISSSVDVQTSALGPKDGPGSSPSRCREECTKIFLPLCGTDSVTYNNLCLLELASCENVNAGGYAIEVAYEGDCVPTDTAVFISAQASAGGPFASAQASAGSSFGASALTSGDKASSVSLHDGSPLSDCPEACTKIYTPVCGSDDQTYNNECLLNVASCKGRSVGTEALFKVFDGPCVAALPRGPVCDESCDKSFIPVCGSDGETYNNICLLELADCQNPFATITRVSNGPCKSKKPPRLSSDLPSISTEPRPASEITDTLGSPISVAEDYIPPV